MIFFLLIFQAEDPACSYFWTCRFPRFELQEELDVKDLEAAVLSCSFPFLCKQHSAENVAQVLGRRKSDEKLNTCQLSTSS